MNWISNISTANPFLNYPMQIIDKVSQFINQMKDNNSKFNQTIASQNFKFYQMWKMIKINSKKYKIYLNQLSWILN